MGHIRGLRGAASGLAFVVGVIFTPSCAPSGSNGPSAPPETSPPANEPAHEGSLPTYASGTRLRARVATADGGQRLFQAWHDTELGVDCAFTIATDGVMRCLPSAVAYTTTYADSSCSTPLIPRVGLGCDNTFVRLQAKTCERPSVLRVKGRIAAVPHYSKDGSNGSCSEVGTLVEGCELEPVAPETFVAAEKVRQARGPRLGMTYLVAVDGAVQALAPHDTVRDEACEVRGDDAPRCVPAATAQPVGRIFTDATCSTPAAAAYALGDACEMPKTVALDDGLAFAELGPKVDATYWGGGGDACVPQLMSPAAPPVYSVGASITATAFGSVGARNVGDERVKLRMLTAESGQDLFAQTFFDGERNEACSPVVAGDAITRCMPTRYAGVGYYFEDPECTMPLAIASAGHPVGAYAHWNARALLQPPAPGQEADPAALRTRYRLFRVGTKVAPTAVYAVAHSDMLEGGPDGLGTTFIHETCEKVVPPSADLQFFQLTEVPASAFPELRTITE